MSTTTERPASETGITRVYVVDDHPIVADGIVNLIDGEQDMMTCGKAGTAEEALREMKELEPDLATVDLSLDKMGGLDLIRELRNYLPDLKILVISFRDEKIYAERTFSAGAHGYIMKGEDSQKVLEALRTVRDGQRYTSPQMTQAIITGYGDKKPREGIHSLTNRELEIFRRIGGGESTTQIAKKLHRSPKTIEAHRTNIRKKLSVTSHAALVTMAVKYVLDEEKFN